MLVMTCTRPGDDLQLVILLYAESVWSNGSCRVLCSQDVIMLLSVRYFLTLSYNSGNVLPAWTGGGRSGCGCRW